VGGESALTRKEKSGVLEIGNNSAHVLLAAVMIV